MGKLAFLLREKNRLETQRDSALQLDCDLNRRIKRLNEEIEKVKNEDETM